MSVFPVMPTRRLPCRVGVPSVITKFVVDEQQRMLDVARVLKIKPDGKIGNNAPQGTREARF
jgi:hypothetical protein